jgi:hypothetical protein
MLGLEISEARVDRRRQSGTKGCVRDDASGLGCRVADGHVLKRSANIFAARHRDGGAGNNSRNHSRLNGLAIDLLANQLR